MRKQIINENWELEEVLDLEDLCAVLFKHGSDDAGYVEAFDFDDCKMKDAYDNLVNQYQEANADDSVHIYLVKLPSTNQVLSLLNSALYNGNERVPEAIEAVNDLCNRADCETLRSWNGCLTEEKKKKKVCSSSYCGFTDPELNIKHFNQCMGTGGLQNPNSQQLVVGDVLPNAPVADAGRSDGASDASSSASEGGAVGESLNESLSNDDEIALNELLYDNIFPKFEKKSMPIGYDIHGNATDDETFIESIDYYLDKNNPSHSIIWVETDKFTGAKAYFSDYGVTDDMSVEQISEIFNNLSFEDFYDKVDLYTHGAASLKEDIRESNYTTTFIDAYDNCFEYFIGDEAKDEEEIGVVFNFEDYACNPRLLNWDTVYKTTGWSYANDNTIETGYPVIAGLTTKDYITVIYKDWKSGNLLTKEEYLERANIPEDVFNNLFNKAQDEAIEKFVDSLDPSDFTESLNEDKDFEIKIQDNENIEEDNEELDPPIDLDYFPNNMGINLSSVKSEKWTEQDDGQLKKVEIEFDPATPEEIEDQGGLPGEKVEESLNNGIDLEYHDLSVDDGEHSHTFSSFNYSADEEEVIKALSQLTEKDEEEVEADLDNLVDKYYNDLLDYFEDKAKEAGLDEYVENQADYDDHSGDEADAWYDTSWERESLTEAHLDYSTQKEKMRQLNNGTRGFNAAKASDEKLRFNRDVCRQEGYNIALRIVEDEMIRRGLISRKIQRRIADYNYIGTNPRYFNEVASKTYWNDKNNPDVFIRDYGNSIEDLLVLYIFAKVDGNFNAAKKLGEYIVERFTITQLELINFASALLQNTGIAAVIEQQLNDRKASGANTSNSTAANVSSSGAVILDIDELSFGLCGLVNKHADAEPVINYCLSVTGTVRNLLMALIFAICLKKDATFIEKLKHNIIINCSYGADLIKETIKDCLGNVDKLNKINELIDRARSLKTEGLTEDSHTVQAYKDWINEPTFAEDKDDVIADINNNKCLTDAERSELLAMINKKTESLEEDAELNEAKRYVKRYYVRPQNIFCSNKEDILKALLRVEGENCSIYSLKNLSDHDDVQELQPSDIIYYYDDGILYDKNHVKVMDYDLNVKHEEERKKFANVDAAPEAQVNDVYDDRLTDADLKDKEAVANFRAINQRQMK